jgi:hypothetical protein
MARALLIDPDRVLYEGDRSVPDAVLASIAELPAWWENGG